MDDERILKLLEEIRDIQRKHLEAYQNALPGVQDAVRLQRETTRRVLRIATLLMVLVALLVGIVVVPYLRR
jgi:hypothetical protein